MSQSIPNRIEKSFSQSLKAIVRQIETALGGIDDPGRIVRVLKHIATQPTFQDYCQAMALSMTTQVMKAGAKTWRDAARQASRGSDIYASIVEELKGSKIGATFSEKVRENASLIKSLPDSLAAEFTDYIQSESLKGRRAREIASDLKVVFPGKAQGRIRLIARTEVSKTQTALTQARAQNLGLSWYVWSTSEDGRVRNPHKLMNGVLIRWDDPPSPEALAGEKSYGKYHAGDTFNCRCYPEPVIDVSLLKFPLKVYYGGRIQMMNKAQFEKIA